MNKPITKKEWMEYLEKTWDAAQEEALAQPEQEPVACPYCHNSHTLGAVYFDQNCVGCVKRMTTPPQPEQEPVAWRYLTRYPSQNVWTYCGSEPETKPEREPLYTTPPQRTWVGLTDEELPPLAGDNGKYMELQQVRRFYKYIEAKLKEKNFDQR